MNWVMLWTILSIWAAMVVGFLLLWRRQRGRGNRSAAPRAFSSLHTPAKPPASINPKTGAPF